VDPGGDSKIKIISYLSQKKNLTGGILGDVVRCERISTINRWKYF